MAALRRGALGVLVGALTLWAGAATALAHGEFTPTIQTVIDDVAPRVEGIEFSVVTNGTARLSVVNRTRRELTILAPTGEPFLRVGPAGVRANVHSLFWYITGNPDGVGELPPGVRAGSAPRWERAARVSRWSWFDHRLHPGTTPVPPDAVRARRRVRLDSWTVPARLGGRALEVSGHVEYRPLTGTAKAQITSPATVAPGVQATLLAGRVPGLFLVNTGRETVTVIGREGEPFARIGRRGVEVNLDSPTHLDDRLAKGDAAPADGGDGGERGAGDAPRWRRVDSAPRYAWLDARAYYDAQRVPAAVARGDSPAVLDRWEVPLRIGTRPARISGVVRWVPIAPAATAAPGDRDGDGGGGPAWPLLVAGLALAAALVAAWRLRSRSRAAA